MKTTELKKYHQLLLKAKHQLTNHVSDEEKEGRDAISVEAKDFTDLATEATGQELSFAISDAGRRNLKDVEEALVRIKDGTYGVCERCQKPIDVARLDAVPHARMCISCQEIAERESGGH